MQKKLKIPEILKRIKQKKSFGGPNDVIFKFYVCFCKGQWKH